MKVYQKPLILVSCIRPGHPDYDGCLLQSLSDLHTEHWFFNHGFDISDSIYSVCSQLYNFMVNTYDK